MASKPSMPRSREQRWSEQDHQRESYHRRLLDYQSQDSHLKLSFVIRTLGDHQYLWIIIVYFVIWNNFVTAIFLVHQGQHFLLKYFWIIKDWGDLQNHYIHLRPPVADIRKRLLIASLFYIVFYRTRVRSLAMLVTHSLTHWLTDSLLFSELDWCDPGVWRCLLKACWGCYCCWY